MTPSVIHLLSFARILEIPKDGLNSKWTQTNPKS